MPFHLLPKLDVKKDPRALLRLFVTCSVISMVLVLLLGGFGFREVLQRYVTLNAEDDAISVSRALLGEEREKIVVAEPNRGARIEVLPANLAPLDRHLRQFLAPFHIVKIKIYNSRRLIVYSTDSKIIGRVDDHNARLERALAGSFDSKLEKKDQVQDLADEVKFDVDVVETYIPVRDKLNRVIGSFEIYMDVTAYRNDTANALVLFVGILALILMLGFGLSYPFIRKGTRDMEEIQEMLRTQAITDHLTGIFNKTHILLIAQKEFARTLRRRSMALPEVDLGLIMLDADRFKEVNDTYGHLAGDVLLKELALRVSNSLRTYDSVGRFGGEEFLVVLPGADLEQARKVAHKMWMLVREEPFLLEDETVSVTASLGVAASRPEDTDFTQVLKRADDALYRAKAQGRDRVLG